MSRQEKLLQRLRESERDASWDFTELCKLLQHLDFEMRVGKAKNYQVRQARKVLQSNRLL